MSEQEDSSFESSEEEVVYGPIRKLNQQEKDHKIIKIIPEADRITSNVIQLLEQTEAIGIRATQIEQGSPVFTSVESLSDPILMAKKEFYDRKSPLILERAIQEKDNVIYVEHWKVREMSFQINKKIRETLL